MVGNMSRTARNMHIAFGYGRQAFIPPAGVPCIEAHGLRAGTRRGKGRLQEFVPIDENRGYLSAQVGKRGNAASARLDENVFLFGLDQSSLCHASPHFRISLQASV
jgi:hypothetical protein